MSTMDMWKANAVTLILLIVVNLALFGLGTTPWMVLGLILLAGAMFMTYRQGMGFGHEACSILQTVEKARDPQSPSYGQVDEKVQKRAWSMSTGVKGVLASALVPYVVGCVYIVLSLLKLYPAMAKFAEALTHRDYLGSLVGLGIEREKIGDIIIPRSRTDGNSKERHTVYVFVTEEISDYIIDNLSYVKHTHIRIERCEEVPDEVAPQLEELSVIVSSNRLDAIVAKLYNLSREQALKLFVEGKVFLNGINMTGNARSLKEGEVVSVRGYGKFIFNGEGGNTKKDKLYIKVSKYV